MLKISIGLFVVVLAGALASGSKDDQETVSPASLSKENPAALIDKNKSDEILANSLRAPVGKPVAAQGQAASVSRTSPAGSGRDAGFAGHADKPVSSNKYQGFPGFEGK